MTAQHNNLFSKQQLLLNLFVTALLTTIISTTVFAQNATAPGQNKWGTTGNSATNLEFIGTTNYQPLIFKTNNTKALTIDATGEVLLEKLNGQTPGLIKHDNTGKLEHIPFNQSFSQVFSSSGVWKEIATLTGFELNNNNIIQTATGNFGLGTTNPQVKLDVVGNVKLSGDLTSPNGIKFDNTNGISYTNGSRGPIYLYGIKDDGAAFRTCADQPAVAYNHLFGGRLQIYDANTNGTIKTGSGLLNLQSWTVATPSLYAGSSSIDASVQGNIGGGRLYINYFCGSNTLINTGVNGGDVQITSANLGKLGIGTATPTAKLDVVGNARISSLAPGGLVQADNNGVLSTTPLSNAGLGLWHSNANGSDIYNTNLANVGIGTTATPTAKLQVTGGSILFDGTTGAIPAAGLGTRMMWYASKSAFRAGVIDVNTQAWDDANIGIASAAFGSDNQASGSNSFATGLTNTSSSKNSFAAGNNTNATGTNSTSFGENTTAQAYDEFVVGRYNVLNGTNEAWRDSDPLFVVGNGNNKTRSNALTVYKNGQVQIGTPLNSATSTHFTTFKLSVSGQIVAQEIYSTMTGWADYVFAKDYKLTPLAEVEKYISQNKHLQDVPTEKEVLENGNNIGETQVTLLKKIEELTLYMIEQNKKIIELTSIVQQQQIKISDKN